MQVVLNLIYINLYIQIHNIVGIYIIITQLLLSHRHHHRRRRRRQRHWPGRTRPIKSLRTVSFTGLRNTFLMCPGRFIIVRRPLTLVYTLPSQRN